MSNKNEVFEYLIEQLRQQVNNNQCEDLAREVLSLKNQLRDATALVAELQKELEHMGNEYRRAIDYALSDAPEQSGCRKEDVQECEHSWIIMPGLFLSEGNPNNVPGSELCSKCGKREWDDKVYKPKNDTQECAHEFVHSKHKSGLVCFKCGARKECEHEWCFYNGGAVMMCRICGLKK